eukprot:EG_transcript_23984
MWRTKWNYQVDNLDKVQNKKRQLENLEMRFQRGEPWPSLPPHHTSQQKKFFSSRQPHTVMAMDPGKQWAKSPGDNERHWVPRVKTHHISNWGSRNLQDWQAQPRDQKPQPTGQMSPTYQDGIRDKGASQTLGSQQMAQQEGAKKVCTDQLFQIQPTTPFQGGRGWPSNRAPPDFNWAWQEARTYSPGHGGQNKGGLGQDGQYKGYGSHTRGGPLEAPQKLK